MNMKKKILNDYTDFITSSSLRSSSSYGSYTDLWLSFSKKEIETFLEFLQDILLIYRYQNEVWSFRITSYIRTHNEKERFFFIVRIHIKENA